MKLELSLGCPSVPGTRIKTQPPLRLSLLRVVEIGLGVEPLALEGAVSLPQNTE